MAVRTGSQAAINMTKAAKRFLKRGICLPVCIGDCAGTGDGWLADFQKHSIAIPPNRKANVGGSKSSSHVVPRQWELLGVYKARLVPANPARIPNSREIE